MNLITSILNERLERDKLLFFRTPQAVYTGLYFSVYARKSLYGIATNGEADGDKVVFVLSCVYDAIEELIGNIFLVRVDDYYGIFDAQAAIWLLEPCFSSFTTYSDYHTMEVVADGRKGLFCFDCKRMVIPMKYDEVTSSAQGDYLWVKMNGTYHFVKCESGEFISLYNIQMAYDTPHCMFAQRNDGSVCCFTHEGYADECQYRKFIIAHQGRGRLQNYKKHLLHIADIYGYVIS